MVALGTIATIIEHNSDTKLDHYPIPHIHDITATIQDRNLFIKLDLIKACHQIPEEPVEKRKISYFGLARNLIWHLISTNQDDLSYSAQTFISAHQIG